MEQKPQQQSTTPPQPSTTPSAAPAQPQPVKATPPPPAPQPPVKSNKKKIILIGLVSAFVVLIITVILLFQFKLIDFNPLPNAEAANNIRRQADVSAILSSIELYTADNQGQLPSGTPSLADVPVAVASNGTGEEFCTALIPKYMAAMPYDPAGGTFTNCSSYNTDYTITIDKNGKLTVAAPKAQPNATVEEIQ